MATAPIWPAKKLVIRQGLELVLAKLRHAPDLFTIIDRYRQELDPHLPFVRYALTASYIENFLLHLDQNPLGSGLVFTILSSDRPSGIIGFHRGTLLPGESEMGYWLSPALHRQGILKNSLRALLPYFQRIAIHALVDEKNLASNRLLQSLNYHILETRYNLQRDHLKMEKAFLYRIAPPPSF